MTGSDRREHPGSDDARECEHCTSQLDASDYDRRACRDCEEMYALEEWEVRR